MPQIVKAQTRPAKALFGRNETAAIAKRFLKPNAYVPARDIPVFYKLFKQYPDRTFWEKYDLGFQLNAAFYLVGADGQAKLKSDYAIFLLDLPAPTQHTLEQDKVGEDLVTNTNHKKPKNLADFLK